MKSSIGTELIKSITERGWVRIEDKFYPPGSLEAQNFIIVKPKRKPKTKAIKTGWTDDTRNIKNKEKIKKDFFMLLVEQELNLEVWPEFHFSTEREFRFDYCIPEIRLGIEQQGGVWAKGKSGHSSGTGIMRDMEKASLASVEGWTILQRTPDQMNTSETLDLIRKVIELKK